MILLSGRFLSGLQALAKGAPANALLSFWLRYEIGDIADSIKGFCNLQGLDRKSTYFWTCCLCINQHRVREASAKGETVPFSQFQAAFSDRVTGIGKARPGAQMHGNQTATSTNYPHKS